MLPLPLLLLLAFWSFDSGIWRVPLLLLLLLLSPRRLRFSGRGVCARGSVSFDVDDEEEEEAADAAMAAAAFARAARGGRGGGGGIFSAEHDSLPLPSPAMDAKMSGIASLSLSSRIASS